ncbi:hypothetical protein CHRYSEOSP005_01290 [Chryseobacterium sp. Alg-005]|uniref:hypothetical protein n=1 Tax=Chryseobacterium sp. Alg-005 TaxID=3159516 RepID=UPI003555951A
MRSCLLLILLLFVCCETEKKKFEKVIVDEKIVDNDTIQLLSKYPELVLFNSEKVGHKSRTAYIIQTASFHDGIRVRTVEFDNYKCKAVYKNDTISIWLNNNNGYFGNGILIQVFDDRFLIKDIDPKTLRNKVKFIESEPFYQQVILNKRIFKKNDSIYGFVDYSANIDTCVAKRFRGYFKTLIE